MGSYTTVYDEEIEIIDEDGLKKYIEDVKSGKVYEGNTEIQNYVQALAKAGEDNEQIISFYGWDQWKIISYWYDEMVCVLRDLAVFIDGEVNLEFETHEEAGWIEFNDCVCTIHTGQMQWQENKPETLANLPELSNELKSRLTARKI